MTSQSPPNYYFNGIIFNSSFYNKSSSTNGITKSQLNTALSQYLPLILLRAACVVAQRGAVVQ